MKKEISIIKDSLIKKLCEKHEKNQEESFFMGVVTIFSSL